MKQTTVFSLLFLGLILGATTALNPASAALGGLAPPSLNLAEIISAPVANHGDDFDLPAGVSIVESFTSVHTETEVVPSNTTDDETTQNEVNVLNASVDTSLTGLIDDLDYQYADNKYLDETISALVETEQSGAVAPELLPYSCSNIQAILDRVGPKLSELKQRRDAWDPTYYLQILNNVIAQVQIVVDIENYFIVKDATLAAQSERETRDVIAETNTAAEAEEAEENNGNSGFLAGDDSENSFLEVAHGLAPATGINGNVDFNQIFAQIESMDRDDTPEYREVSEQVNAVLAEFQESNVALVGAQNTAQNRLGLAQAIISNCNRLIAFVNSITPQLQEMIDAIQPEWDSANDDFQSFCKLERQPLNVAPVSYYLSLDKTTKPPVDKTTASHASYREASISIEGETIVEEETGAVVVQLVRPFGYLSTSVDIVFSRRRAPINRIVFRIGRFDVQLYVESPRAKSATYTLTLDGVPAESIKAPIHGEITTHRITFAYLRTLFHFVVQVPAPAKTLDNWSGFQSLTASNPLVTGGYAYFVTGDVGTRLDTVNTDPDTCNPGTPGDAVLANVYCRKRKAQRGEWSYAPRFLSYGTKEGNGIQVVNIPLEGDGGRNYFFMRNFFVNDFNPSIDYVNGVEVPLVIPLRAGVKNYDFTESASYVRQIAYDLYYLSSEFSGFSGSSTWTQEWTLTSASKAVKTAQNSKVLSSIWPPVAGTARKVTSANQIPAPLYSFWLETDAYKFFDDLKTFFNQGQYDSGGKQQQNRFLITNVVGGLKLVEKCTPDSPCQLIPATRTPYTIETIYEFIPVEAEGGSYYGLKSRSDDVCRKMYWAFGFYQPTIVGLNKGKWTISYEVVIKRKPYRFNVIVEDSGVTVVPQGTPGKETVGTLTVNANQECKLDKFDVTKNLNVIVTQDKGNSVVKLHVRSGENGGCSTYLTPRESTDITFINSYRLQTTYSNPVPYGTFENPTGNFLQLLLADVVGDAKCSPSQKFGLNDTA